MRWYTLCVGALLAPLGCGGESEAETGVINGAPDVADAGGGEATEETSESGDTTTTPEPEPTQSSPEPTETAPDVPSAPEPTETDVAPTASVLPTEDVTEPTTDATSEGGAGNLPPVVDAGPPEPSGPVWLYTVGTERYVISLDDPSEQVGPLSAYYDVGGVTPWSEDGRWLADVGTVTDQLQLYDLLVGAEPATTVTLPGPATVLGWLKNVGVLLEINVVDEGYSAMLVTPAGEVQPLTEPSLTLQIGSHGVSPDGRYFNYVLNGAGTFELFNIDITDPAAPSMPMSIATSDMAPPMSFLWSNDSQWFAFGVPGAAFPISLWSTALRTAAVSGAPVDASYTPLYTFSPASDAFLSMTGGVEEAALAVVPLTSTGVGEVTVIERRLDVSPADWSPEGNFITYSAEDTGWIQSVVAGVPGARIELTDWSYGCPMTWIGPTQFIYQTCLAVSPEYMLADVGAGLTVTPYVASVASVAAVLPGSALGGDCIALWDESGLRVGVAKDNTSIVPLETVGPVDRAVMHPTGEGVSWSSGANVYWQRLSGCAPTTEATSTVLSGTATQLILLPD